MTIFHICFQLPCYVKEIWLLDQLYEQLVMIDIVS